MFAIIMSMSLFMLAAISIRSGASEAADDIRKNISTGLVMTMAEIPGDQVFKLVPDDKGEMIRTLKVPLLTRSHLEELLDIDGVEGILKKGTALRPSYQRNWRRETGCRSGMK